MQTTTPPTHEDLSSSSSSSPNGKDPGRPTLLSRSTVDLLLHIIATTGRSDSAAAELAGISTSTISRWKQDHPTLIVELLRAREQFRERQLQIINDASTQRGGWRAAAWLLERIFPEDYSPRASEREKFIRLAEARQAAEEEALLRWQDSQRAETPAALATRDHARPAAPATLPGSDSQNSQNPAPHSLAAGANPLRYSPATATVAAIANPRPTAAETSRPLAGPIGATYASSLAA